MADLQHDIDELTAENAALRKEIDQKAELALLEAENTALIAELANPGSTSPGPSL